MFFRAVGVQKGACNIHDLLPVPGHDQARFFRYGSHHSRFQVFRTREFTETICIFRAYHDRHALLRFTDRQFGTVKTVIFFRDLVQIDQKTVRQFADGDRYAACPKVVAALDQPRRLRIAEQAL